MEALRRGVNDKKPAKGGAKQRRAPAKGSFWVGERRVRGTDPSALCLPALLAPFRTCPIYGEILELGAGLYFVA